MSLILDALKKIEKDKEGNLQKQKIDAAILRQPGSRRVTRSRTLLISCILFAAAALLAAGAGISQLLSDKATVNPVPAAKQSVPPERQAVAVPEEPLKAATPAKAAQPETALPAAILTPAAPPSPAVREIRRQPQKVQPVKPPAPTSYRREPVEAAVREETPAIAVGGIIWSEESGRRRALVNGATVKEGDTVDGFRVERIESTRIRFSKEGKSFEVPFR